jgi:hypothetical protein
MASCGITLAVAAFLPWYTLGGWLALPGTDDDGPFTLLFGLLAVAAGFRRALASRPAISKR